MTPLRQQMHDAMLVRGLVERTRQTYIENVARLAIFYHRNPADLTPALRDRSRVVPRSHRACVFTKRFMRSENAGFTKSRRVIAITMLHTPCWVCNERSRTAGAAEGISGRVIFAAF